MPRFSRASSNKPDPILVKDQLQGLRALFEVYGSEVFCRFMLWILQKKEVSGDTPISRGAWNRRLVPFNYNTVQRDLDNRARARNIMLKYRQGGYTTWCILRRLLVAAILDPGSNGLLISRNSEYVAKHFAILRRAYRLFGAVDPYDETRNAHSKALLANVLHLSYSSRKELIFDQLDSTIFCGSAESVETGQGATLHHVVCDDIAHWAGDPEELMANMKEAIVEDGTLDLPSTANGRMGYFYEECMRASDPNNRSPEFFYFFHEWWWDAAYRKKPEATDLTEEERALRRRWNLDLEQIAWRREKKQSLRAKFPERYPEDRVTCFLTTGRPFFDMEVVAERYNEVRVEKPLVVEANGDLVIFKKRIRGRQYIIGADSASGQQISTDDTDFSVGKVIDLETGEDVAVYRARIPPEDFAMDLAELGHVYNDALIAPERTGDGHTVMLTLQRDCGYGNIYRHPTWDKKSKRKIEVEGWPTTPKTRPTMLNKLAQFLRHNPEMIHDVRFLEEAMQFVRDKRGIPSGATGYHDDVVMAAAIAHMVRLVKLGMWDPLNGRKEKYGDVEGEDDDEAA